MRIPQFPTALGIALFSAASAHAEFLYDTFLTPSFDGQQNTEFSNWDIFYAPNGGANFPDAAAPNGSRQTASSAGFTPPADSNPVNPSAYWNTENPTITQTNGGHFIIGPGSIGNIYSPSNQGFYSLADSVPYTELGTAVFQFQTEGNLVEWDSLRLVYDDGVNGEQELAPSEWIREYRSGGGSFGGLANRTAVQWDLTGLGITEYEIRWNSESSSMSFQRALLDTAQDYASVVPSSRTWIANGSQNWTTGANWQEGTSSIENGNARFENTDAVNISLTTDQTIGELIVDTASTITIGGPSTLTSNTGITKEAAATGTLLVSANFEFGAFNLMDVDGGEVRLNGVVSGAFGFQKIGDGTLVLGNSSNTFGTSTSAVGLQGGTLRIEGSNAYGGTTTILWGKLELAANTMIGSGALGTATSAVTVGASSATFDTAPQAAEIVVDGAFSFARAINVELGTFEKRIGAKSTGPGTASFSGNISLLGSGINATNLSLFALGANDTATFSGTVTGGTTESILSINPNGELGTVIFAGSNKTYASQTTIHGGTLQIASGTSTTGNGAWSVGNGATLQVDGTLAGNGTLALDSGSTLRGNGTVSKTFTLVDGATLAAGNSTGSISTLSQTWDAGAVIEWEINAANGVAGATYLGWDLIEIVGELVIDATALDRIVLDLLTLDLNQEAGWLGDFDDTASYDWTLVTTTDGISGFNTSFFEIDASNFQNPTNGAFAVFQDGDNLILSYTAVPEPGAILLLILGATVILARYKFSRSRSPQARS